MTNVNIRASRKTWAQTRALLESLTVEDLQKAAKQELAHESISNPAVKELLKLIDQIGNATPGSDETKGRMLTELKSSFVYFGCPVIYLTINPTDRHSPLSLLYAGEEIDVNNFNPDDYNYSDRVRILLRDPLAAVDYFHNMIQTIIEKVLKGGMFGKLIHHYATVEYQGRFTPHVHMAVRTPPPHLPC